MALRTEHRWASRPRLAAVVRTCLYLGPALFATVVAVVVRRAAVDRFDAGSVASAVVALAAATLALFVAGRASRRFLPLAMLLRLSLVFPDEMPHRLGVAIKAASPKRLARIVAAKEPGESANAEEVLALVAALNAHDRRTRGHSERVRALTMVVADELGLAEPDRNKLEWAAMLHDIGKMTVPASILNKAGRPDPDEWARLQGHPAAGAEIATPLDDWLGEWRHAIGQHHERVDGTGYPDGLAGDEVALSGRIVAVTDAFETMTATRSYKKPMTAEAARRELVACAGTHFDPAIVRAFTSVSLTRIHGALGPASWLGSLPFGTGLTQGVRLGGAILGGRAGPALAATAAAVLTVPATAVIAPIDEPPVASDPPAIEEPAPAEEPPTDGIGRDEQAVDPAAATAPRHLSHPAAAGGDPADPAHDAVDVVMEIVDDSTPPDVDPVDPVTDTVEETVDDITDTATETIDDTTDTVEETVDDVTDTATETIEDAATAAGLAESDTGGTAIDALADDTTDAPTGGFDPLGLFG